MLRSDVTGPRPVNQTDATTTLTSVTSASQETLNRLSLISAGRQLQAQIMSRLNDGTFLVRVADTTARMALPDTAKTGDTITLTLLSPGPRPTFVLGDANSQSVAQLILDAASTTQVGKAAATGEAAPVGTQADSALISASTSLSQAGRLVDNLLHAAQLDGMAMKIRGQSALLPAPPSDTAALAQTLKSALEFSGLFYESHLNQWANGARSIEDLMREPQANVGTEAAAKLRAGSSLLDMMRALEAAQQQRGDLPDQALQSASLNNETARLISLQLAALEQRRIAWQGELWPGRRFEWEVSEDTPGQDQTDQGRSWRSTVRFEMPTLGTISASINLTNGRVQMQIRTGTEAAATTLRAHGNRLAVALEAAGSPLDMLTVNKNESA